jgi:hypothetical protein
MIPTWTFEFAIELRKQTKKVFLARPSVFGLFSLLSAMLI